MRRCFILAVFIVAGWLAARSASAGYPNYLTLKSDNQGASQDVIGTTYAWGWFGATPGAAYPVCHQGYYGNCWLWYYYR